MPPPVSNVSIERLHSVHLLDDELSGLQNQFERYTSHNPPIQSPDHLRAALRSSAIVVPKSVVSLLFEQCVRFPSSSQPALPPRKISSTPRANSLLLRTPRTMSLTQSSPTPSPGMLSAAAEDLNAGKAGPLGSHAVRRAASIFKLRAKHGAKEQEGKDERHDEPPTLRLDGYLRCCTIIKRLFLCCLDESRDAVDALVDQLKMLKPPPLPQAYAFPLRQRYRQQQQRGTVQSHIHSYAFADDMTVNKSHGSIDDQLDMYGVVLDDMKPLLLDDLEVPAVPTAPVSGGGGSSPSTVAEQTISKKHNVLSSAGAAAAAAVATTAASHGRQSPPISHGFVSDRELLAKAVGLLEAAKVTDEDGEDIMQRRASSPVGSDDDGHGEVSLLALRCALANYGLAEDPFGGSTLQMSASNLSPVLLNSPAQASLSDSAYEEKSSDSEIETAGDESPLQRAARLGHIPQLLSDPLLYAELSADELRRLLSETPETQKDLTPRGAALDFSDTLAGLETTIQLLRTNMKFKQRSFMGKNNASQQATFTAEIEGAEDDDGVDMMENPMTGQLEPVNTDSTDHPLLHKVTLPTDVAATRRMVTLARVEQNLFMTHERQKSVKTLGRILHGAAFGTDTAVVVEEEEQEEETEEEQEFLLDDTLEVAGDVAVEDEACNEDEKRKSGPSHDEHVAPVQGEETSLDLPPTPGVVEGILSSSSVLARKEAGELLRTVITVEAPDEPPRSALAAASDGTQMKAPSARVTIVTPRMDSGMASKDVSPRLKFVLPPSAGNSSSEIIPQSSSGLHAGGSSGGTFNADSTKGLSRKRSLTLTADDSNINASGAQQHRRRGGDGVKDNASSATGMSKKLHPLLHKLRTLLLKRLQKQRTRLTECGLTLSAGAVLHTGITPTNDALQGSSGRVASTFELEDEAAADGAPAAALSNSEKVFKRNAHLSAMDKEKQKLLVLEAAAQEHQRKLVDDRFRVCDMSCEDFYFVPQVKKRSPNLPFFLRKSFGPPIPATTLRSALRHRHDGDSSLSATGHVFLKKHGGRSCTTRMSDEIQKQKDHAAAIRDRRERAEAAEHALLSQLPIAPGIYPTVEIGDEPYNTKHNYRTLLNRKDAGVTGSMQFHAKKQLVHSFLEVDVAASQRLKNYEPPAWASRLYCEAETPQRLAIRQALVKESRMRQRPASAEPVSSSVSPAFTPACSKEFSPHRSASVASSQPRPQKASTSTHAAIPTIVVADGSPRGPSVTSLSGSLFLGIGSSGSSLSRNPSRSASRNASPRPVEPIAVPDAQPVSVPEPVERTSLAVARGVDFLRMRRLAREGATKQIDGNNISLMPRRQAKLSSQSAVNLSLNDDPAKSVVVSVSGVGHVLETSWFQKERAKVITHAVCKALRDSGGPSLLNL
jgi:hypothetical protein